MKKEILVKMANNILELMVDPTRIPVKQRLYFRPEEVLDNSVTEAAMQDSKAAYGEQKHNSDMYPLRNKSKKTEVVKMAMMDRKTIIASLDVLAQNFDKRDPMAIDLREMATVLSKMEDNKFMARRAGLDQGCLGPEADSQDDDEEEVEGSTKEAKKKAPMVKCPACGGKVLKATGYCLHCKDKIENLSKGDAPAKEEKPKKKKKASIEDGWSEDAASLIATTLAMDEVVEDGDQSAIPAKKELGKDQGKEAAEAVKEAPEDDSAKEKAEHADPKKHEKHEKSETPAEEKAEKEKVPAAPETPAQPATPVMAEDEAAECMKCGKKPCTCSAEVNAVDTSILKSAFEGIELDAGIIDLDGLSTSEQENLGKLF